MLLEKPFSRSHQSLPRLFRVAEGHHTLRGTPADAVVLGLWVKEHEERFMLEGGFDGFYTYFGTNGFTYGSTTRNWPRLAEWARARRQFLVPCVAPGYIDTRIRPWNGVNTRERKGGAYYDRMWTAALGVSPDLIGITSFNEWHEGTQIEPADRQFFPGGVRASACVCLSFDAGNCLNGSVLVHDRTGPHDFVEGGSVPVVISAHVA